MAALSARAPTATMKCLLLILMLSLPTLGGGHSNVTNADVLKWVATAPKSVKQNFRITLSNEVAFHPDLSNEFLPPRIKLPFPWPPPCFQCPPGPELPPDPADVIQWVRTAPAVIRQNFQIGIIVRNVINEGDVESPTLPLPPPKEILIQRLWAAAF
jgi:hypothetical protein